MNHLKPHIRSGKQSETLHINQLSLERAATGETVFGFGFGQSPFPVPAEIQQVLARSTHRKEYMAVQGHPPLRHAIAAFHNTMENKHWSGDQIIVGAGSKILIFCLLAAFKRAEVVLPAPSWVSYEPQAKLTGHKVNWIGTKFDDQWRLTPEQLEQFCSTRSDPTIPLVLILNYPSNPTGQTYTAEQSAALADVMRKHRIVVIADEIYSLLDYGKNHVGLDEYYPEGCIVSSGLSKWCGAGGWRLGFIHIAEQIGAEYFQAVTGVASETYSCAAAPVQLAATHAYSDTETALDFLAKQTDLLHTVSEYCSYKLRNAGVNVHAAQGGFYLFPQFTNFQSKLNARGIRTSEELTTALLNDTGVVLLPGSAFGMPDESLTARLAFVDFDGEQILNSGRSAPEFNQVKMGIAAIVNWLEA